MELGRVHKAVMKVESTTPTRVCMVFSNNFNFNFLIVHFFRFQEYHAMNYATTELAKILEIATGAIALTATAGVTARWRLTSVSLDPARMAPPVKTSWARTLATVPKASRASTASSTSMTAGLTRVKMEAPVMILLATTAAPARLVFKTFYLLLSFVFAKQRFFSIIDTPNYFLIFLFFYF